LTLALLLRGKVKKRTQNTAAQFLPMGPCPLVKTNGTLPIGKDQWVRTALRQNFFSNLAPNVLSPKKHQLFPFGRELQSQAITKGHTARGCQPYVLFTIKPLGNGLND